MPNYRRWYVPGATYFFTAVALHRRPIFASEQARKILGDVFRECQQKWPFQIPALVLLKNHLHTLWTLPPGDIEYSTRWGWLKKEFTRRWLECGGKEIPVSDGSHRERRRGIWQRRFWEHTIDDEDDFENHFHYIHFNPVKHGLVLAPRDWHHSSFHRYVESGVYHESWGSGNFASTKPQFLDLADHVGEPE